MRALSKKGITLLNVASSRAWVTTEVASSSWRAAAGEIT
jgi:hypothetical protein